MNFRNLICIAFFVGSVQAQEAETIQHVAADTSTPNSETVRAASDRTRITTVTLRNLGRATGTKVPVTFGQIFKLGDVPKGFSVKAIGSSGEILPTQIDVKARHEDGSLRHAVVSLIAPQFEGNAAVELVKVPENADAEKILRPRDLSAEVSVTIEGERYRVAIHDVLRANDKEAWLSGPVVAEWRFVAVLKDGAGKSHPHLALRGNIRKYRTGDTRLDLAVENGWVFAPGPRDYTYDVSVKLNGKTAYEKSDLVHYHLSRWRKVLWWGSEPKIMVSQAPRYLIESRAVPTYDWRVKLSPQFIDAYAKSLTTPHFEPMGKGIVTTAMATTGGRPEIGPLPAWAAAHVISPHPVTWNVTLAMGDLSGSWPIHYRDQKTDLPATLDDYPNMTLLGTEPSAFNKATGKSEWFPSCDGRCKSPFAPDSSHQPSFAYLPYLLSGDYYYLEELLFWANWNLLETAPPYRSFAAGLLKPGQVRAQAWGLRTLAQAAYIAPDKHPLKRYFIERLRNNLAWYNKNFPQSSNANKLGALIAGYAIVSNEGTALPPWQDDFFTWAVGYAWALGFSDALPLLTYKAKFPIGRMIDPDYCWIFASEFVVKVRASKQVERLFENFGDVYRATVGERVNSKGIRLGDVPCGGRDMADWLTTSWNDTKPGSGRAAPGEMVGYAYSPEGFPAILQPALAVAVDADAPGAQEAWRRFISRAVPTDYGTGPQFAIVPLKAVAK